MVVFHCLISHVTLFSKVDCWLYINLHNLCYLSGMWADNSSGKTSPVGPVCNWSVWYALQPVFWSSGPCWTTDRSSSILSVSQFSCGCWLGDGVDAVSTASRKLLVFDAAVTFGWHSVDGGLAAGKVSLRIIDRCCGQEQVSVTRNQKLKRNHRLGEENMRITRSYLKDFLLILSLLLQAGNSVMFAVQMINVQCFFFSLFLQKGRCDQLNMLV